MNLTKIISGGQTGADFGGLEAGKILGIETGGTAPKGYKTERGTNMILLSGFNLRESNSSDYKQRTKQNIQDSDGTVIFGDSNSAGSALTLNLCKLLNKPWCLIPLDMESKEIDDFLTWIGIWNIQVLNVAGNRESVKPGIQYRVQAFLYKALKES